MAEEQAGRGIGFRHGVSAAEILGLPGHPKQDLTASRLSRTPRSRVSSEPYSDDLRERVIEAVVAGASRREAAESFSLSASSAVRWLQRWYDTGNARAKLSGGSTSPLEGHVEWLLALVAEQPDLTLDEIVVAMRKQRIPGSRTAVWRFFERHNVTVQKNLPPPQQQHADTPPAP